MRLMQKILLTVLLCQNLLIATIGSAEAPPVPASPSSFRLTTVGDIYLGGPFQHRIISDPSFPFLEVQSILSETDVLVGNLEVALSLKGKPWLEKIYLLRSDPRSVHALKNAGFDGVSLANNHMMDYGTEALGETLRVLAQNGISYVGAGRNLTEARKPAIIRKNGHTIAMLAYNNTFPLEFNAGPSRPGTAPGKPRYILEDIKSAKAIADWVIVSFHWGEERSEWPKEYQETFAHKCIDAGATVVFGHHPHVLQGIERYKNGLIAYSLGNFSFASWSKNVSDSIILQMELDASGVRRGFIYPVNINNYEVGGQTRLRHGEDSRRVLRYLQIISSPWNTTIQITPDAVGVIEVD